MLNLFPKLPERVAHHRVNHGLETCSLVSNYLCLFPWRYGAVLGLRAGANIIRLAPVFLRLPLVQPL